MSSCASVDIIIVNYRGAQDCLQAIRALHDWRFGRLWLVDNSEDTAEAEALRHGTADFPWVQLIVAERNLGFGQGCNLAFERSNAPYCMLVNPDALISPNEIEALVAALDANPSLGAVSPLTYWDRQKEFLLPFPSSQTPVWEIGMALASRHPGLCRRFAQRYLLNMRRNMASGTPIAVPFLAGALLMLRREAVLKARPHLFDPQFFMFFEDSDLSLALRRAGYGLAFVPGTAAVHEYRHKPSKGPLMAETRLRYFRSNFPRFFRWSDELRGLDRFRQGLDWWQWGEVIEASIADPQVLTEKLDGAGIVAWSPSPMMMPCIFRPEGSLPAPFSADHWDLLEPGRYMLAVAPAAAPQALRLVSFERAPRTC